MSLSLRFEAAVKSSLCCVQQCLSEKHKPVMENAYEVTRGETTGPAFFQALCGRN